MSIYESNISPWQLAKHAPRVLSNIYYMFRAGKRAGKPFGIKFEVSSLCNLRCIMCPLSKGLKRKQGVLSFNNFRKVFDQILPSYLNLTGIGEPLLNPDLFKIIKYARGKGAIVKLDTNATLLDAKKAGELLSAEPNIISVSIDGSNKKSYEKIRRGANFDSVISNLKNLILLRNKKKRKSKIHVNFVLQKSNIIETSSFIKFMDSLGVDAINGDISLPLGQNSNLENREISKEKLLNLKNELKHIKTRAQLNIEHIIEFLNCGGNILNKKDKSCFYPWYYPSITWDGNIVPCCYICDNEIVFGNVFEQPFMKIWNNRKIQDFRNMISKKRVGICASCFIDEKYISDNLKILHKLPVIKRLSKRNNQNN